MSPLDLAHLQPQEEKVCVAAQPATVPGSLLCMSHNALPPLLTAPSHNVALYPHVFHARCSSLLHCVSWLCNAPWESSALCESLDRPGFTATRAAVLYPQVPHGQPSVRRTARHKLPATPKRGARPQTGAQIELTCSKML